MDDVSNVVGSNIAHFRAKRQWRQKDLAAAIGVEALTISRYETGAYKPSIDRLYQIAAALGCGVDDLIAAPRPHFEEAEAVA